MPSSFAEVRERIHQKSHSYFSFKKHLEERGRQLFYGASDALLDASTAASSYASAIGSETSGNLLACYGFLQALYVEQDAVETLFEAIGLEWSPNNERRLDNIRDARNRLVGHPSNSGRRRKMSSGMIIHNSITSNGFSGVRARLQTC